MRAGRRVFLATSRVGRVPRTLSRRRYLDLAGRQRAVRRSPRGLRAALGRHRRAAAARGAAHHQPAIAERRWRGPARPFRGRRGRPASFAGDVAENVRFADEFSATTKARIDAYIAEAGISAPAAEPDPAETVAPRLPDPPIRVLDPGECGLSTVLWCSGFQGDFSWLRVPGALDARGQPRHADGIGAVPGLYFPGMDFASTRRSGTILAIAEEGAAAGGGRRGTVRKARRAGRRGGDWCGASAFVGRTALQRLRRDGGAQHDLAGVVLHELDLVERREATVSEPKPRKPPNLAATLSALPSAPRIRSATLATDLAVGGADVGADDLLGGELATSDRLEVLVDDPVAGQLDRRRGIGPEPGPGRGRSRRRGRPGRRRGLGLGEARPWREERRGRRWQGGI